jgi:hypothetical protein
MHIQLAYGKSGLPIEFPDNCDVTVVELRFVPAQPDPMGARSPHERLNHIYIPVALTALRRRYRDRAMIAVMPESPQTIAYYPEEVD